MSGFLRRLALLLAVPHIAVAADRLGVEDAVSLSLQRNPSLLSLSAEVSAARARLTGASPLAIANPELEVSAGPRMNDRGGSTDYAVGLSQRLEVFGQRGLRMEAARDLVGAAEARLEMRRVEVAAEARTAFVQTLAAHERARLASDGLALAQEAHQAAESRQRSGAASGIEVNAARVALGRAAREQSEAEQRRVVAAARLLLLLGMDTAQELQLRGELKGSVQVPTDRQARIEAALEQRPDLAAARRELQAARADVKLAGREALPSPRLGVSFGEEEGSQVLLGTFGIDLPLFQRNQAVRGVASARAEKAALAVEGLERAVRAEVVVAVERLRTANMAATAFGAETVAAAHENLQLVNEGYKAGKLDFFQLLVIRREALEARASYLGALEELGTAEVELTRASGSIE